MFTNAEKLPLMGDNNQYHFVYPYLKGMDFNLFNTSIVIYKLKLDTIDNLNNFIDYIQFKNIKNDECDMFTYIKSLV